MFSNSLSFEKSRVFFVFCFCFCCNLKALAGQNIILYRIQISLASNLAIINKKRKTKIQECLYPGGILTSIANIMQVHFWGEHSLTYLSSSEGSLYCNEITCTQVSFGNYII